MKLLSYLLAIVSIILVAYGVVGRFSGPTTVGFFGITQLSAGSTVLAANTALLLAILIALYSKK